MVTPDELSAVWWLPERFLIIYLFLDIQIGGGDKEHWCDKGHWCNKGQPIFIAFFTMHFQVIDFKILKIILAVPQIQSFKNYVHVLQIQTLCDKN